MNKNIMSFWTYPAVIISVYTYKYISERKFKSEIKKCLDSAPRINNSFLFSKRNKGAEFIGIIKLNKLIDIRNI